MANATPYATNGSLKMHWLVLVKGQEATLIGFHSAEVRDMDYAHAQAIGGDFSRMCKARGTEVEVRQLIDAKGWLLPNVPIVSTRA